MISAKNTILLLFVLAFSCNPKTTQDRADSMGTASEVLFPERAKSMAIYEVNIRQYTPEGTINAFSSHLPRLNELGVDILWLMPVQPVGIKNRKGSLGSYYSIRDYTQVNPDFGTLEDFKNLVQSAHDLGMLVILDWVANHTSFDHPWTEIKGYHTLDSAGNITMPVGTDWSDVADLNYENERMRVDMIEELKWWVVETDIDGFRCDVAGMVPIDFWNAAKDSLDRVKDLFMLAEWDEPKMHDDAFHMSYAWGPHHWMNDVAKGHLSADSLESLMLGDLDRYGERPFRMMFTTNHDENSWNGTVYERFGDAHKAFALWAFTVRGMPLIYSGQEAGLKKRLRFFEKDTIDFGNPELQSYYATLLAIKHENEALYNGEYGGGVTFLDDENSNVSSFQRSKNENVVTVIINFSSEPQEIKLKEDLADFVDEFTNRKIEIKSGESLSLAPFEYLIDLKNSL